MMKKLILICVIGLMALGTKATHLMGGDMVVKHDSTYGYYISLTHYRDIFGIPVNPNFNCDIYKLDTFSNAYYYTGAYMIMQQDVSNWGTLLSGIPYGVESYSYLSPTAYLSSVLNTLGAGKYRFVVYECCRNQAIQNMSVPLNEGFTLMTDLEYIDSTTVDNTPECLSLPVIYGPVNNVWNYNPFPYDADGDSIAWQLNDPIGSNGSYTQGSANFTPCLGYTLPPATATNPFSLNATTGEITWEPNMIGNFVASFKIDEYDASGNIKGTTIRDMQYIVIPDSAGGAGGSGNKMPAFGSNTNYQTNSIDKYNYIYYVPGMPLTFRLNGTDVDAANILNMESFSNLYKLKTSAPAVFVDSTWSGNNTVTGVFKWTPAITETRDQKVVFRVMDGMYMRDFTLVLKKWNNPQSISNEQLYANAFSISPNPIMDNQLNIATNDASLLDGASISIYQINGAKIKEIKASAQKSISIKDLNLQTGLYFVSITKNGQQLKTLKFVVQ
jgi:Secretion system C-terminal sorting domain